MGSLSGAIFQEEGNDVNYNVPLTGEFLDLIAHKNLEFAPWATNVTVTRGCLRFTVCHTIDGYPATFLWNNSKIGAQEMWRTQLSMYIEEHKNGVDEEDFREFQRKFWDDLVAWRQTFAVALKRSRKDAAEARENAKRVREDAEEARNVRTKQ